jgi:hypothetical protein
MVELRINDRERLAELWLPWCVERDAPNRILRIDHEPHRRDETRQLRVRDIDDPAHRTALANNGGTDSTAAIHRAAEWFDALAREVTLVLAAAPPLRPDTWPQAFPLPEGPMLHEACHRACGIYAAAVQEFELRALQARAASR